MYTNYYKYPINTKSGYTPYPNGYQCNYETFDDQEDDRLFLAPFLLGGLTGAAVAPYFYRPYYYPYPPYPYFRY